MKYKGKLYGKIANKYFPIGKTDEIDALILCVGEITDYCEASTGRHEQQYIEAKEKLYKILAKFEQIEEIK
jgi:hypothetical protein